MKRILKIELHKAFHGRLFLITLLIAIGIALLPVAYHVEAYHIQQKEIEQAALMTHKEYNPCLPEHSLFNSWICVDYQSLATALYWFLSPIFVSLAFAWSLCAERKSGYIKNIVVRTTRRNYYVAKLLATFVSGGGVIAIPATLNLMITAMFLPAVSPDVYYRLYYPVRSEEMFSEFFFSQPVLYAVLRLLIVFMFGGALATVGYSLSFILRNRVAVVILPFFLSLAVAYLQNLLPMEQHYAEFAPIYLLGENGIYSNFLGVIVIESAVLLGISFSLAWGKGGREDVF